VSLPHTAMDAFFDNDSNILNANIRMPYDNSVAYSLKTTFGLRGRKVTVLRDENPAFGRPGIVAIIHWKEKVFEISGIKKRISEIQRAAGGLFKKIHHWQWASERKEYVLQYNIEGWKAILSDSTAVPAQFSVPLRPRLFGKPERSTLHLARVALEEDEVFMILVFIYSEEKRQDRTNSSSANGGLGW